MIKINRGRVTISDGAYALFICKNHVAVNLIMEPPFMD